MDRKALIQEAEDLGLEFPKNIKTATLQDMVDEVNGAPEVEMPTDEPELVEPSADEIRAQIQAEFDAKLKMEKAKILQNVEANVAKGNDVVMQKMLTGSAKVHAMKAATKLMRVNIVTKDPSKSSWEGEIFTVGNDVIGSITKYVPYNIEDGYHLPQIFINMLREKKCTIFINKKGRDGKSIKVAKTIKAYSIEELPPLTERELKELADDQRARQSID